MRRLIAAAVLAAFGLGAAGSVLADIPFPVPPKFTDIPFPVPPKITGGITDDIPFPVPPR
ncbi:MAG TPA: hypothetical protein VH542_02360 [Steroidobacteraceae bacterium]|jgi:hypothetical protein